MDVLDSLSLDFCSQLVEILNLWTFLWGWHKQIVIGTGIPGVRLKSKVGVREDAGTSFPLLAV